MEKQNYLVCWLKESARALCFLHSDKKFYRDFISCRGCNLVTYKTAANGTTAAQVNTNERKNNESRSSFFHIYRDVTRYADDGELLPTPWRREWLHLTPAGRYVWTDHDHATDIRFSDSCRIVDNLQAHGNAYRFNYGKIWQH